MSDETSAHQIFRSRVEWLQQHTAIVAAALECVGPKVQGSSASLAEALTGTVDGQLAKHPASQWQKIHKFSKRMNGEHSIHLLYAHFDEYVRALIDLLPRSIRHYRQAPGSGPSVLVGELTGLDSAALDAKLANAIIEHIKAKNGSRARLEFIEKAFRLKNGGRITAEAYYVLDVRNALVHEGGFTSRIVQERYEKFLKQDQVKVTSKGKITLTDAFVTKAPERVERYVAFVDGALVEAGIVASR